MKRFLAFIFCIVAIAAIAQNTVIRKGGGGSGGSATNAVTTVSKDGVPIVSGALAVDFTNAAGTVVTVTSDGTTARIGIPISATLPTYVLTNNNVTAATFLHNLSASNITATVEASSPSVLATTTLTSQGTLALTAAGMTANRALYLDISKHVTTSPGVTATELEYLDGVTEGIQGQLNSKLDGTNDIFNTGTIFNGIVSNSNGGFWTSDTEGFVSYSSPTDFMILSHPQGGIFNTLDGWVLGDGVTLGTILSLSLNTSIFPSDLWVQGVSKANNIKLAGGQTASSILRLDSSTNLATVTIGSGLTFDGTTLTATGGSGTGSTNPVAFTSGTIGSSNWFGLGYTNTGSNASQTIDMMGPQVIRSKISGNTAFTFVNMDLWTNTASYGSTIRWDIDMAVPGSAVTFTTLHPINWGKGGTPFLSNGDTNFLTISWNGNDVAGSYSHSPWVYEYASGSTLVFDAAYGPAIHSDTNRLTANTTCILTNLENGTTLQANFIGDSGSSDYTATFIPHLGTLIVNMDTFAQSKTNSFTITCSNKQVTEVYGTVAKLNGTNLLKMSVSRASFQ